MEGELAFKPRIVGFLCNWCCYGGADLCGVSRFQYPPYIRVIRVMCSGRVDPEFVLRAFANGVDGVFVGGCHINDCHYNTEGNYDAFGMVSIVKKLLVHIGLDPERLRLEWVSAGEGIRFAEVMNDFSANLKKMGRIGKSEGVDEDVLKRRLDAAMQMVPYIKLVERERLHSNQRTEQAYADFYASQEFDTLFRELITDKLEISQMIALLREKPRTTSELGELLGLTPSDIARHANISARQGLCRFDESKNLVAAAYHYESDNQKTQAPADTVRPAALDNERIEAIIAKYEGNPGALIHVLMEVQSENQWLPKEILNAISDRLDVPLSRVMQIASFYKTFSLTPKGRHRIHVCSGTSCHLRGADELLDSIQALVGVKAGEVDADAKFSLETGCCLGSCTLGPEIIVDGEHHGRLSADQAEEVLKNYA
jgi:coenzyme F420-reducing hydrogenase delta subunit/NADH:ubiquinone oxidoreductase subunit E